MGANAQTSVPTFTAGDVLTAANMNISARTGVPVFADTTARDAGFGGTGEKVLAEGQLCYVENLTGDAQIQYYDGSTWNSLGAAGLTLITAQTIGSAVASVTVSNVFSSTYDNYKITLTGGALSASYDFLRLQLGSTTTGYYSGTVSVAYGTGALSGGNQSNTAFGNAGIADTNQLYVNLDLFAPNLAKRTQWSTSAMPFCVTGDKVYLSGGFQDSATQFTAFTLTPGSGTLTGGTIRVYGYRN